MHKHFGACQSRISRF